MILLAYILIGHPEWQKGEIKIFSIYQKGEKSSQMERLLGMIGDGRLPISRKNVELISQEGHENIDSVIEEKSHSADLTIMGFSGLTLADNSADILNDYNNLGNVLFVSAQSTKVIS